jgi:peptide/nickel transport system substrate-binding protein
MKRFLIPVAIILVISFLLTACGQSSTTSTTNSPVTTSQPTTSSAASTPSTPASSSAAATTSTTPAATSAIKKGGTLRIIYEYSPATIPGWTADSTNPQKLWADWICFEGLVKLDINGVPSPWLATDWKWGPQNAYMDFNLRKDVKFHDGTNFTAESVITHVNQLFNDKDSATGNWDRIEKTGDYSFRLYLKSFMRDFWLNVGGWSMFFTSDTQLKEKGLDYVKSHPVGTGPFKFASFEKDVSLKFVKNENYWQPGKPYMDGIDFFTVKEPLTQQAKMEANEGDVLQLKTGKILQDLRNKGLLVLANTNSSDLIMFDTKNEGSATNDPKVRQAIEYAINKQEMADALGYGGMYPNNQIPNKTNPAYYAGLPTREYNPDKAKALLKEAGYANGLKLKMLSENAGQDYCVMVQSYLAAVGITLDLEMVDNGKLWNYLFTGWQGLVHIEFAMGTNWPYFLRTYFPPVGTFDVSVKIPDDVLAKINAAMVETDDAKFQTESNDLLQWVYDNAFFVPTVGVDMGDVLRPEVKDSDLNTKFIDFTGWSPQNTWLDR